MVNIHVLTGESPAARYWIHAALQRRHPGAEALAGDPYNIELAANLSCAYGQQYEREGSAKRDIARFYYRLAAGHGHPRAVERLRALRVVPFGKLLPAPIGTEHRPGGG
ncbi:hypothetical protein [Nonomuraea helvata]|uniref:Sel1 repeat family protein n=1 Tax=Nonomuraea helvata TaxID=37484 RepID=A0ABV5SD81_9ACTN